MYGKGISKEGSLLDVGVDLEIIKKSGAWFTYEGEQLGQGQENARAFLAEHTDVRDEIERKVREAVGLIGFSEDDDQPIEIVPDLVELEPEPPVKAGKKGEGAQCPRVAAGAPRAPTSGARDRASARTSTSGRSGSWRCGNGAAGSSSAGSSRPGSNATRSTAELDRLELVGLIDDEAFARAVVESRMGSRGESRRVVAGKLAAGRGRPRGRERGPRRGAGGRAGSAPIGSRRPGSAGVAGLDPATGVRSGCTASSTRRGYAPEVARQAARRALATGRRSRT